jgi:HAMP domain-containing protein
VVNPKEAARPDPAKVASSGIGGSFPMNDTRPDSATATDVERMVDELQKAAEAIPDKCSPVSDAILGLIAAIRYDDQALVDSALASLGSGLAPLATACIAKELDVSRTLQCALKDVWQKQIDKRAFELAAFEEVKDIIESAIEKRLAGMLKAREVVDIVEELGHQVEDAQALEEGIRQLRKFREEFLRGWPSRVPPSPIDQEAINKARQSFRDGYRGLSKGQMIWKDKRSENAV